MTLQELLDKALTEGASDIHLVAGSPALYRIAGEIKPLGSSLTPEEISMVASGLTSAARAAQLERDRQICFLHSVENLGNFRITVFYDRGNLGAAIRVIPANLPPMEKLGLPKELESWALHTSGLLLVTGPMGAGKTTTLNIVVDTINRGRKAKIITIEDPIEFIHRHKSSMVVQKEVGSDTSTLKSGLKQAMREDPDVIVIGELMDSDMVATALMGAETGHLIVTTLQTRGTVSTLERISKMFPAETRTQICLQLSESLVAVIAQNLLPQADGSAQILAYESLTTNPSILDKIKEQNWTALATEVLNETGEGIQSMDESIRQLFEAGLITYETAAEYVTDYQMKVKLRQLAG